VEALVSGFLGIVVSAVGANLIVFGAIWLHHLVTAPRRRLEIEVTRLAKRLDELSQG
jgi:hypothetical protein